MFYRVDPYRSCLSFTRVSFESFFRGYFSVFPCQIVCYLTRENGKKTGRKRKDELIIFLLENLDRF